MVGLGGPDEFPDLDDGNPTPFRPSDIDDFSDVDALDVLDGDAVKYRDPRLHGGHRHGSRLGKSEFPVGWDEARVVGWTNGILRRATRVTRSQDDDQIYRIRGVCDGVPGVVVVRAAYGVRIIATAHPEDL